MVRFCEEHNRHMEELDQAIGEAAQGLKYDGEKIDWAHLPSNAVEEVLKVYMMGAKKYHRGNYLKGIDFRRIFNAAQRHLWAWKRGEDLDPESGLSHLAHATWNCLTLLEYMLSYDKYKGFDNRSELEQPPENTVWPEKIVGTFTNDNLKVCEHEWQYHQWSYTEDGLHIKRRCKKCRCSTEETLPVSSEGLGGFENIRFQLE